MNQISYSIIVSILVGCIVWFLVALHYTIQLSTVKYENKHLKIDIEYYKKLFEIYKNAVEQFGLNNTIKRKVKDPFKVLGIPQNASYDQIKNAYRTLIKKYHPDRNKDKNAPVRFREICEAYEEIKQFHLVNNK